MRRIRSGLWGAALSLLLLAAAACSGEGDVQSSPTALPSGGAPVSGEISFLTFGEPEEIQAYRTLIDAFEEAEPNVTVNLIEASDREDLLARLSTSFAGGTPPDLFLINYRFFGQFASTGVLEPLQPRLDSSAVFQEADFYPQPMEAFRVDGQLVCMPQNVSSLVVYYNKDLFAAAGLSEPTAGWTWDQMVQTATTLTKDSDGDGVTDQYGLGIEPSIIRVAPFIWSNGGEVVDDEANPTGLAVDSPESIQAMQDFFDLHQVHGVVPGDEEVEAEDNESRFMNGTMGMLLQSRRVVPSFRTISSFDWDVAPLPQHGEAAGILHSDAYCLTRDSQNKEAAWRFVEFALGPDGAPVVAGTGRTVPSLISVAESDAFLDPSQKPANSQVFLDTIEVIRRVPNISTWPEIEDAVEGPLQDGLYLGVPAEDVAAQMIEATESIFARAE
jgi:multiple sugar transport system substrate-binding protein